MRYLFDIQFDGTEYHGWQRQPNAITVQEVIEKRLNQYTSQQVSIVGCGRTDTGVHANQYFFHCDIDQELTSKAAYSLNSMLPSDVFISKIQEVNPEFNARFDATHRTYKYFITHRKSVFNARHRYPIFSNELPLDLLNRCSTKLLDISDFASFCKVGSEVKTTLCKVTEAMWQYEGNTLIFTITADRFLRNMVRAIVGSVLEVGQGNWSMEKFAQVIASKDRNEAGRSVPGKGLFLWSIGYEHLERFRVISTFSKFQ